MSENSEIRLTKKSMKIMLTQNIKTTGKKTSLRWDDIYFMNSVVFPSEYIHDIIECQSIFKHYMYCEYNNRLFFHHPNSDKLTEIIKVTHKKTVLFCNNNTQQED